MLKRSNLAGDIAGALLCFVLAAIPAGNAWASTTVTTVEYEDVIEDGDAGDSADLIDYDLAPVPAGVGQSLGSYGPFRVVDGQTIVMDGAVDSATPRQFKTLLAAHPGVKMLKMVDCPGSEDDDANLLLARMVHKAGIATHVPSNGSIRSGAIELFLAGKERTSAPGAQFGVHSWQDDTGREARDYAEDDAVHTPYLSFYREVGFTPERAKAFYAFTNAASFSSIHYMTPDELSRFGVITAR
jgi:hypothetical protein